MVYKDIRLNRILLTLCVIIATFSMCGCSASVITSDSGKGSCQLTVAFVDVPEEFYNINENVLQNFFILVRMKNVVTDKDYVLLLNKENNYKIDLKVPPGTYHVKGVSSDLTKYIGAVLSADNSSFVLEKDGNGKVGVRISNIQEFVSIQNNLTDCYGIARAGRYSRNVMLDGQIYGIQELLNVLELSSVVVGPYSKGKIVDEQHDITIFVANETGDSQSSSQCRVTGMEINGISAVMPGGISVGMDSSEICGADGIYGTPDSFSGCAVFNEYLWETDAIYVDPVSGDKITISFSPYGGYVSKIKYEFEVFE